MDFNNPIVRRIFIAGTSAGLLQAFIKAFMEYLGNP